MERILLPVDGSNSSDHAVRTLTAELNGKDVELHLLNVQLPFNGGVGTFVDAAELADYHREMADKALRSAREILDAANIPYVIHHDVGHVASAITTFAGHHHMDRIVLGTQKRGFFSGILLGSVAADVVRHASVPVEVIPAS
jgi:nucleotide-binding universal stress UspA family protein